MITNKELEEAYKAAQSGTESPSYMVGWLPKEVLGDLIPKNAISAYVEMTKDQITIFEVRY